VAHARTELNSSQRWPVVCNNCPNSCADDKTAKCEFDQQEGDDPRTDPPPFRKIFLFQRFSIPPADQKCCRQNGFNREKNHKLGFYLDTHKHETADTQSLSEGPDDPQKPEHRCSIPIGVILDRHRSHLVHAPLFSCIRARNESRHAIVQLLHALIADIDHVS
jgi:hypothetical protein